MHRHALALVSCLCLSALGSAGCTSFSPDDPPAVIHARFDPDAKVIPMPSDVLRDDVVNDKRDQFAGGCLSFDVSLDQCVGLLEQQPVDFLVGLCGASVAGREEVLFGLKVMFHVTN